MLGDFDGSWEGLGWEGAGRAFDHTELGGLWKEFGGHNRDKQPLSQPLSIPC